MELFRQAFTIMTLGMALVFVFLAVVILAVRVSAHIIHRIEGPPREESPEPAPADPRAGHRRAAAIAAALHRFRHRP
jgi:sodium pump decarboxylase gamma subunit